MRLLDVLEQRRDEWRVLPAQRELQQVGVCGGRRLLGLAAALGAAVRRLRRLSAGRRRPRAAAGLNTGTSTSSVGACASPRRRRLGEEDLIGVTLELLLEDGGLSPVDGDCSGCESIRG